MKARAAENAPNVRSRFSWLRNDLLAMTAGICYHGFSNMISWHGERIFWFNRDPIDRSLLLNVRMPTTSGLPRLRIEDHDFMLLGDPDDFECPPQGKLLSVRYENGDSVRVEFIEIADAQELGQHYDAGIDLSHWQLKYPLTACVVQIAIGGSSEVRLGRNGLIYNGETRLKGPGLFVGREGSTAINIAI